MLLSNRKRRNFLELSARVKIILFGKSEKKTKDFLDHFINFYCAVIVLAYLVKTEWSFIAQCMVFYKLI